MAWPRAVVRRSPHCLSSFRSCFQATVWRVRQYLCGAFMIEINPMWNRRLHSGVYYWYDGPFTVRRPFAKKRYVAPSTITSYELAANAVFGGERCSYINVLFTRCSYVNVGLPVVRHKRERTNKFADVGRVICKSNRFVVRHAFMRFIRSARGV